MSTIDERLLDRVRIDLGDIESPFDFAFAGDGIRDHFNVEHRPIKHDGLMLYHDGLLVEPDTVGVAIDHDTGILIFGSPPSPGEVWELQGKKHRYFSDSDLVVFIDTALAQHSHNRGDSAGFDFTRADIPPVEEYPIALLATIQALWALATDAAFDIDIIAPDGVNIPRSERFAQLMEVIGARQRQYDDLAAALNIGVSRIETFITRRTAKLTNRLVPVYLPSEFDDNSRTKRVLYPPNLLGSPPVKTGVASYDVDIVTGDPKSFILDFAFDLTGATIKNAIRRAATGVGVSNISPPVSEWTQEVIDAPNGQVRFSLTGSQTRSLQYNSYWEVQVTRAGEDEPRTKLRGLIRATNSEVVR